MYGGKTCSKWKICEYLSIEEKTNGNAALCDGKTDEKEKFYIAFTCAKFLYLGPLLDPFLK